MLELSPAWRLAGREPRLDPVDQRLGIGPESDQTDLYRTENPMDKASIAPRLSSVGWYSRGENACHKRRAELRAKADAEIMVLKRKARTQIEVWSLEAQTDLASQTLTSNAAKAFLASMPKTADLMPTLEYQHVVERAQADRDNMARLLGY